MVIRGTAGYVLVALGGLVVSAVPSSSGLDEVPLIGDLRAGMPGRMLGLAVVVAGLGLASSAWMKLIRDVRRGGTVPETGMTLVRRATTWWCVPLLLTPAMFSRDGWSYAAQGNLTRLGLSPYAWTPQVLHGPIVEAVDPRWMGTLTPYGPLPLMWGALAAGGTQDPWLLVIAHRGLALVGLAMLAYAVPKLASWAGREPVLATAIALPSPLMLSHGVAGLHNDLLMVGLMALALVWTVEHGWVLGAVTGGVAAAVKLPGGLVCIGVALLSLGMAATRLERLQRLAAVGVLAIGTVLLAGAVAGVGFGWIHALAVPGEVWTPLSVTTQIGRLTGLVLQPLQVGVSVDGAVTAMRAIGSVAALAIAARMALRAEAGVRSAGVRAVALVMVAVVALSPVVHPWYMLWFLPHLASCRLSARSSAAVVHVSWLAGLAAPLDSSLQDAGSAAIVAVGLVGAAAAIQFVVTRQRAFRAPGA